MDLLAQCLVSVFYYTGRARYPLKEVCNCPSKRPAIRLQTMSSSLLFNFNNLDKRLLLSSRDEERKGFIPTPL